MGVKNFITILVFLFCITTALALAPPIIPDKFTGNVLINDEPAPIGTEIKIYVNNKLEDTVLTTTIGKYTLYVKTGNSGDEIKLLVNDIQAAISERQGGETINLDLSIGNEEEPFCGDDLCNNDETCSTCQEDCGECSQDTPPSTGGGSSGGGDGGGSRTTTTTCTEDWECMTWFSCKPDGTQTRICTDKNNCGTITNKPLEIQECVYEQETVEEEKEKKGITGITGAVIGFSKENTGKIVGVVVFLLALGLLWQFGIFNKITRFIKSKIKKKDSL